jgi:hypothetical protein
MRLKRDGAKIFKSQCKLIVKATPSFKCVRDYVTVRRLEIIKEDTHDNITVHQAKSIHNTARYWKLHNGAPKQSG